VIFSRHQYIVIYKTAYYSFYLPVALGMYMAGMTDPKLFEKAKNILIPLGEYFQVQDDYLDCYGAAELIGKIGTDILDNKCSWNVNVALKYATPEQRRILDENYGQKNADCEKRVKDVFEEIGVERRYKEYQEEAYKKISGLIDELDETPHGNAPVLKRQVFRAFLEKIYGRTK
jgi:farnesyl diphosphate synthase